MPNDLAGPFDLRRRLEQPVLLPERAPQHTIGLRTHERIFSKPLQKHKTRLRVVASHHRNAGVAAAPVSIPASIAHVYWRDKRELHVHGQAVEEPVYGLAQFFLQ